MTSCRRDTCRACGSQYLQPILCLAPTPVGDAYLPEEQLSQPQETYPLDVYLCSNCSLAQLTEVVNPEILYGDFRYTTSISLGLVEHFQYYADEVAKLVEPTSGKLVVDVGSNDGTLLRFLQKHGLAVLGVEPAARIAQNVTQFGVETLPAFFTPEIAAQIRRTQGVAALVTANNTLANVDALENFVSAARSLLADDGLFVFETGYWLDIVDNLLFDTIYHEHLCYFTVRALIGLLERNGMVLIDAQRISTKGGSLRGIAQLAGARRPVSSSVATLLAIEQKRGLHQPESFVPFAAKVRGVKDAVFALLSDLKSQGKSIAGYGASVGVTTLLYYFEIGNLLNFLIDDNPAKHNLYSPGYHLPVLPSTALYERRPDYVLILSWRYAEPIMAKHKLYREQVGRFIRFLPTYDVLSL